MGESYRVRAIVFDLDGVLVDSMPAIRGYWTDWAGRQGVSAEEVLGALHLTAEELVRKFAPNLDASVEARATAVGQAGIETGIVAFEAGKALIDRLPRGRWAVVTSGKRELALRHLALGHLTVPDVLISAEDTPRGKPDPAGYLLAADRLGISPSHCLAIEDSPAGVRAARSAGMYVVAVTTSHSPSELVEADAVVSSLAALRLALDQQRDPMEVVVSAKTRLSAAARTLRGVIFDMDGVLVLSEPFIAEAAIAMFAEKGHHVAAEDFRPFIGTGEDRFIGGVAASRGITLDPIRDKARTYEIYVRLIRGRLQPLAGVHEFVRACRAKGLALALASGADRVKVDANLREVGLPPDLFDTIVDGTQVNQKKPAPDIFREACRRLSLPPSACLVIEDAVTGVSAAKAAGARCLALTTTFEATQLVGADWIAPDLSQAPAEALNW